MNQPCRWLSLLTATATWRYERCLCCTVDNANHSCGKKKERNRHDGVSGERTGAWCCLGLVYSNSVWTIGCAMIVLVLSSYLIPRLQTKRNQEGLVQQCMNYSFFLTTCRVLFLCWHESYSCAECVLRCFSAKRNGQKKGMCGFCSVSASLPVLVGKRRCPLQQGCKCATRRSSEWSRGRQTWIQQILLRVGWVWMERTKVNWTV